MIPYTRKGLLIMIDMVFINLSMLGAILIVSGEKIPKSSMMMIIQSAGFVTLIKISIFFVLKLYKVLWQYASIKELQMIVLAVILATIGEWAFAMIFNLKQATTYYFCNFYILTLFIGITRFSYYFLKKISISKQRRAQFKNIKIKNIMVIGAGEAGSMLINELKMHPELRCNPVVIVDDDKRKKWSSIHGVSVLGDRSKIIALAKKHNINEIIFAIPSAPPKVVTEILTICKETNCKMKTLPGVFEIIDGKIRVSKIRDINIEDLLGREEIVLDTTEISGCLQGVNVLVTGGGGSIGSELCRQIAPYSPKKLIILDIYENNVYNIQNELLHTYGKKLKVEVIIASIRDIKRLNEIFEEYHPAVVFHAAAHKHVPLMEKNPSEAIKNNVFGTFNMAQCADKYGVTKFVLISTDKAVNPTNVMGATKRIAEMIVQTIDKHSSTEFATVRFGNVLGSNGSVIPLFKKQIEVGGPLTLTHKEVTRFFMTIPEAAQLVIQACAIAKGGEVFILDMGKPIRIIELAEDLIRLSGFEPYTEIPIVVVGLRPGEKLYEELLLKEEGISKTKHEKIFIAKPIDYNYKEVLMFIKTLENCLGNAEEIKESLAMIVKTYKPYVAPNIAEIGR